MKLGTTFADDKVCSRCENAWPATPDYWYSGNGARGFHTYCIPCFLAYYRERRVAKAAR